MILEQTSVKGYTKKKVNKITVEGDMISLYKRNIYENDHQEIYTEKVKEEMEYRNKIRYIILKNIMLILLKHVIKSAEKNEDDEYW